MDYSFGSWVRRRRKALDLTQQELAQRVGCSLSLIFKIESDQRRPSRQIAELFAEHLKIPLDQRDLFLKVARQEKGVDRLEALPSPSEVKPASVTQPLQPSLPLPLTSIVGREHELRAIIRQFQDPACRLLTLTGPGGVGKTRLALEVAHHLSQVFEDGVCFVSLTGTAAPEFVTPALADALCFSFSGMTPLKAQLFNFLEEKQMLIVLDNLEHLLNGIELLDELLRQAPNVKLLATSREQLNLRAEWAFEVEGLPVPSHMELEYFESNSAVALFLQRAKQAKFDFVLSVDDYPDMKRICQFVEGLPLALELAATWVRMLSVREIAHEIERNMDFLTTTARDVPQRHRSIRAVFDHSWALLTDEEQGILRQLAVFSGGFTREAAEQVAGATISHLSALVDKSLLRYTGMPAGRYGFHELIRQYVDLKAQDNPEEHDQMHERHASYFAYRLQQWENKLQGAQQQEILTQISLEIDNIRSAWDWMVTHRQTDSLQQSLMILFVLHDIRNWLHQGSTLFEKAIAALQSGAQAGEEYDANPILLGELMACQGHLCWHLGQTQKARRLLQRSLQLLGSNRNRPMLAEALLYLSLLEHWQGNYPAARQLAEECVVLNREQGRVSGLGYALSNLGLICLTQGEHETAYACLQESVAVMRSIGHPRGIAINLIRLGLAVLRLGRFSEAQMLLEEGLETTQRLHDRWGIGNALNYLGLLAFERSDFARAEALIRESAALFREDGDQIMLAATLTDLGYILTERNMEPEAWQSFREALKIAQHSGALPIALYGLAGIAALQAKEKLTKQAFELATYSWEHSSSNWQTKDRAGRLRAELKTQLRPRQLEAVEARAGNKSFEDIVEEALEL
ncbi:MAG TPA: tetratricopeptide repeat protein [Anaerolineales bacterium]|nr:tetratricopeptide repeat protein [Anaerolineales bacterium]